MGAELPKWRGAYAAVVTPFTKDGALDENALRANLELTVRDGAHGAMVGGQYGEGHSLSKSERIRLFNIAAETIAGRIVALAATGDISTQATIELTRAAEEAGLDGAMIEAPIFLQPRQSEVLGHFQAIAAATPLPIMLCNTPARVGFDMTTDFLADLLKIPNVIAIKHSGTDFQRILEMVERYGERLAVFIGPSRLYGWHGVLMGAAGFMDGLIQVVGRKPVELYDAAVARDMEAGIRLQRELFHLGEIIYSKLGTSPTVTKEAMRMLGRPGGWPRPPLLPLEAAAKHILRERLSGLGFLPPLAAE